MTGMAFGDTRLPTRFWSKVEVASGSGGSGGYGCWLWTAAVDGDGYPRYKLDGAAVRAHRYIYAVGHGIDLRHLPTSVDIHHVTCNAPRCVRFSHLFAIDHSEHGGYHGTSQGVATGHMIGPGCLCPTCCLEKEAAAIVEADRVPF